MKHDIIKNKVDELDHLAYGDETQLVAQQPILNSAGEIWGYELLLRDIQSDKSYVGNNSHSATSKVMLDGFSRLRPYLEHGQKVLINYTPELLEAEVASILPAEICAIEILEDILPTPNVLKAVKNLKELGYTIALDDFIGQESLIPFLEYVDIVKVDVLEKSEEELFGIINLLLPHKKKLLAEKVETLEMAELCKKFGFTLFQGFFFSKGETFLGNYLTSSQATKSNMLALSKDGDCSLSRFSEIISSDPLLSYRLLTYINSIHFGLPVKISSIDNAVALVGKEKLLQWFYVITLAEGNSTPISKETSRLSAIRGKFLERLAIKKKKCSDSKVVPGTLFLIGLFSLLEKMLSTPFESLINSIPMNKDIIDALTQKNNPYSIWLRLVECYDSKNWQELDEIMKKLNLSHKDLIESHVEAINWSEKIYS